MFERLKNELAKEKNPTENGFLHDCIKEAMRKQLPIMFVRRVEEDTTLGNYVVPKGTRVFFHNCLHHFSPQMHENAEEYDPERWKKSEVPFLGFGLGTHRVKTSKHFQSF